MKKGDVYLNPECDVMIVVHKVTDDKIKVQWSSRSFTYFSEWVINTFFMKIGKL